MPVALLQLIEQRLAGSRRRRIRLFRRFRKRSAVALILRIIDGELNILMIKRADREGDPWSGHMAFPGGRMEPEDRNGLATAVRETREEVGLALNSRDRFLGRLSDINARPRGGLLGMLVSAYVFRLDRDPTLIANEEVAEVLWVPLEFLLDTDNREEMEWQHGKLKLRLPCYNYQERRIWGLSLMMLDEMMDLVEGKNPQRRWKR